MAYISAQNKQIDADDKRSKKSYDSIVQKWAMKSAAFASRSTVLSKAAFSMPRN